MLDTTKHGDTQASIKAGHRLLAWLLLVLLTAIILFWPIDHRFEYQPIQTFVLSHLTVFAVVYCLWALVLIGLLFLRRDKPIGHWEEAGLLCVFSVVFLGSWLLWFPNGFTADRDGGGLAFVQFLQDRRHVEIPGWLFGYFQFPRTSILGSIVMDATGLELFHMRMAAMLGMVFTVTLSVYAAFRRILGNGIPACMATLLLVQGNIAIDGLTRFIPSGQGIVLTSLLLLSLSLLYAEKGKTITWQMRVILLLLIAATAVTHAVTSIAFAFVILASYLLQERNKMRVLGTSAILLALIIPVSWHIYWAHSTFRTLAMAGASFLEAIRSDPATALLPEVLFLRVGAYAGPAIPIWASATRIFWWVSLFGVGTFLAMWKFAWSIWHKHELQRSEVVLFGGMLGVVSVVTLATLISPGATQFYRFLAYGGFFVAPVIAGSLWNSKPRKPLIILVLSIFLVMSFPTFLAHNGKMSTGTVRGEEHQAMQFVTSSSTNQESLHIFTDVNTLQIGAGYLQQSYWHFIRYPYQFVLNEPDFIQALDDILADFKNVAPSRRVFLLSPRSKVRFQDELGISPSHPAWERFQAMLLQTDKVYNNGFIEIYK